MGGKKDISYFDAETQKCILDLARQMTKDELERHIDKKWIVVEWKYLYGQYENRSKNTIGKRAFKL